jgi:hypothetical protein
MKTRPQCVIQFLICLVVLSPCGPARADPGPREASEYQLKAAFLLNFGRFTEWPPAGESTGPINLCVVGRDPFGTDLDQIVSNQSIHGRPIKIVRVSSGAPPSNCQILFVGPVDKQKVGELLSDVRQSPTLTVSDIPGFTNNGGMIQFLVEGQHIQFLINLQAASQAGLKISSKLLKIAKLVQ